MERRIFDQSGGTTHIGNDSAKVTKCPRQYALCCCQKSEPG